MNIQASNRKAHQLELVREVQENGCEQALEQLVEENRKLIWSVVNKFKTAVTIPEDDKFQMAVIGFIKAVKNFDTSSGYALSTYAYPKIYGEIQRLIRDEATVHVPRSLWDLHPRAKNVMNAYRDETGEEIPLVLLSERMEVSIEVATRVLQTFIISPASLDATLYEDDDADGYTEIAASTKDENEYLFLYLALEKLEPTMQTVVKMKFFENSTQDEIAEKLGKTQTSVSRYIKKALQDLRAILGDDVNLAF